MNLVQKSALIFTIVGGINWGLIGIFGFNLVEFIFGTSLFTSIIYGIVGVCALINIPLFSIDLDD